MTKPRKRRSSILKESNEQTQDLANVTFPIRKKRVSWAPKEHDVRFFAKDSPDQNTPEGRGSDGAQSSKFRNVAVSSSFAFETLEEESFKMQRTEKQDRNGMGNDNNASMMMNLTCVDPNDDTLTDETIQQSSPTSTGDITAFDNSQMEMTCVQDTSTAASLSFLDDVSETTCVDQASFVSSGKDSFEESSPPTNVPAAPVLPPSLFQRNDDKTTCSVKSMDETNIFQPNGRKLNQYDDDSFTLAPTSPMGRKSFGDATTYSCVAMNETNVISDKMAGGDADELAFLETVVGSMEVDEELASQGSEQQYCVGPASMAEVSSSANTSALKPAQEPSPMKMLEPVDIESPAKTPVRKESLDSSKTSVVSSNIKSPANEPIPSLANTSTLKPAQELSHIEMLDSFLEPVDIESPAKTPARKESLDSSKTSVPMDVSVKEAPCIESPARKESLDSSKTSVVPSKIESPALSTSLKWGQAANESSNSIHPKQGIASSPLSMSAMNFSCSDLMVQSFSCSMNEDVSQPQASSKVDVDTFFGSIAPELSLLVTNWDEDLTAEDLISNAEKLIENPLEKKVFKKASGYLLEEINKMKLKISALKERFNENNPEIVNEYRFNQTDETKQKLKEIVFQCKDKTKDYMKQLEEKLRQISSSTVNNELFAQIEPFVDEMESKLANLQLLCDDLMKKVDNERKDIEERMKKIWGDRTPPSKDELEKAFHLLTCIENWRKGNAEIKENEEEWNYLMKRQKRLLDEYNQFSTLVENEEKHRRMILDNQNNEYQLCDVVEKSRTKWVHSYMKNSLIFTATFDQENPSIVTEYSLKSNIKDNYSVPECDIKLYELAHEIVKYKMDFTSPPTYPLSLREKILMSTQVEVNVSRAIELQESIIQSSIEYMGKIKLTWKESDVIEARIKGFNILKRLIIRFTFVERSETGRVKSANFLPISFKIVQNNTNVSESFVSKLLEEATSREHIDPTLFRRLVLHKLHLECTKSTTP